MSAIGLTGYGPYLGILIGARSLTSCLDGFTSHFTAAVLDVVGRGISRSRTGLSSFSFLLDCDFSEHSPTFSGGFPPGIRRGRRAAAPYLKDERVEVWYAQNTILYVARGRWVAFPGLQRVAAVAEPPLATVHPRLFVDRSQRLNKAVLANAEATAQAEQLTEALAAERENVRALGDRVERLEQIATQEHARAEASQQEAQRHRWTVEQVQAELAQARVEKEALRVELVRAHFLSEPRNMSWRGYLRALPQVVRGGLRRAMRRAASR
jgi:hypothetical protein